MMRLILRYVVMIALMFWQGGFTFYVSVVVPVSTEVLGSPLRQGFITRPVTAWLNVIAAIALAILLVELLANGRSSTRRAWFLRGMWLLMVACQGLLFWLHRYLDSLMQEKGRIVLDPEAFYPAHRVYLWTHTIQWAAGLVFLGLMLRDWQKEDRQAAK